jgi:hypothetical protein
MQIRLRPSGGRGEYELAGSHGSIKGADLYGLELALDFGLDLRLPLYAVADVHDGKPRIRLADPHSGSHAAKVIAALLLMPQPIREIRLTAGTLSSVDFLRCAFSSIVVDVVKRTSTIAVLRPRAIVAINGQGAKTTVDVLSRFEFVKRVWRGLPVASDYLNDAVGGHYAAATASVFDHKLLIAAAARVLKVPGIMNMLDPYVVVEESGIDAAIGTPSIADEDPSSPIEVNRELRKRLAWRADRGPDGQRFRKLVHDAYGFKCAFTGESLPSLGRGYSPGVDAAHIFPWSLQGCNDVTNGISLSKQMHWAFDNGLLRLQYDPSAAVFCVDIPQDIPALADAAGFHIGTYEAVCGPIATSNLPTDPALWPSRKSLELYNELMFPQL